MHTAAVSWTGALNAFKAEIDGGTPPATWEVRTGTRPANLGVADTGTILASGTLANPSGTVTGTTYTFTFNADASADASGTPGYLVIKQGGTGTPKHRLTAGTGTGEVNFNANPSLGGNVSISLAFNAPADT